MGVSCGRAGASVLGHPHSPSRFATGVVIALVLALLLIPAAAAAAAEGKVTETADKVIETADKVSETADQVTETEAIARANLDPTIYGVRAEHPGMTWSASKVEGHWEVAYFADDEELALALVDPVSGEVTEAWTGYQVAWKMARGYSGQFGHKLNAPYVFIPFCLIFLIGLFDWKRWRRVANLDLLVLLGFGVSHIFFNRGEIGVSVPLQYPVLLYLLGRALWIGFRGRGEGLRPVWPVAWMIVAALFLMGVRVGLNVADAGAIDVGYASIVGADRVAHGEAIYDNFPDDVSQGDTYGPVNYYAYVPFETIWPWSGTWDDLPGAHGAAVTFDLLAFGFLILLGIRIRPGPTGRRLAAILAFGWAAYPYTAFALESNSNDTLVAALLIATLLVLARPVARGALASLATFAKFAPALLAPMLLTYRSAPEPSADQAPTAPTDPQPGAVKPDERHRERTPRPQVPLIGPWRSQLLFVLGFAAASIAVMLWPTIDPGLHAVYDRTIAFQSGRDSPFSIWGQVSLDWLRATLIAATAVLSLALAFRPRDKSLVQVAALGAALLIALQLTLQHWFYLYIVWFYPLLLVAMAALPSRAATSSPAVPEPSPARSSPPAPVS
jgi:hypothetical protein